LLRSGAFADWEQLDLYDAPDLPLLRDDPETGLEPGAGRVWQVFVVHGHADARKLEVSRFPSR
jgi:hypothetical protein